MNNYLNDVAEDKVFLLGDKKIRNLYGLLFEFRVMSDDTYSYYANNEHNYFADWIQCVIVNKELSDSLRDAKSRKEAVRVVEKTLDSLKEPRKEEKVFTSPKQEVKKEIPITAEEEVDVLLKKIAQSEKEIQTVLWKHFTWDMAKEFMYGMAIGMLIGLVLAKIFFKV